MDEPKFSDDKRMYLIANIRDYFDLNRPLGMPYSTFTNKRKLANIRKNTQYCDWNQAIDLIIVCLYDLTKKIQLEEKRKEPGIMRKVNDLLRETSANKRVELNAVKELRFTSPVFGWEMADKIAAKLGRRVSNARLYAIGLQLVEINDNNPKYKFRVCAKYSAEIATLFLQACAYRATKNKRVGKRSKNRNPNLVMEVS